MNLIFESFFISIYCVILLFFLLSLNIHIYYIILIFGFIKHYFGYIFGIHNYYCNYKLNKTINNKNIIIESILESIWFYFLYSIINKLSSNIYIVFFIMGFITHILAEIFGIHNYFLINNCL